MADVLGEGEGGVARMNFTPHDYQAEDLGLILGGNVRNLVAWEQGLGKTVQTYMVAQGLNKWPLLVVCPAHLKTNWAREAAEKFGLDPYVCRGASVYGRDLVRRKKVVVVNYEILPAWGTFLSTLRPRLCALDECQRVANLNTATARAVHALCEGAEWRVPHLLALSGTPLLNRPWELYSVLSLLWPEEFDSPFEFGMTYCYGDKPYGKWKFGGAKNLKALHARLVACGMVRRTKAEVFKGLPAMRRFVVPVDMDSRKDYDEAERDVVGWLAKTDLARARRASYAEAYTRLGYLKRLAARHKLPAVIDWVRSFLAESEGKLVLGAYHRDTEPIIPRLLKAFKDTAVTVHGGVSMHARDLACRKFQEDPGTRLLVGQIQAVGLGYNLSAASDAATVEFGWQPALHQQFDKRIDRPASRRAGDGLTPPTAWYLPAAGTVDEKLCRVIQAKQKILDNVLDGVDVRPDSLVIADQLREALLAKHRVPNVRARENGRPRR